VAPGAIRQAVEAVAALEAELAAADELVAAALEAGDDGSDSSTRLTQLRNQIESASQRVGDLSATLDQARNRPVVTGQISPLAPLPSPPAPR
jgi:outer membrane protein TolC